MHTNHRRKKSYRNPRGRWYGRLTYWKDRYWTRERARERHLMAHGRFDDCQVTHPKSVLWDAL